MSQATDISQLREKVLRLAREIESLSEAGLPPDRFFPQFLDRLAAAVAARGAAVWLIGSGGLRLVHHLGLEACGFYADPQAVAKNEPLLREALQTGETKPYPPGGAEPPPTDHLYVVAPLSIGSEPIGALEVLLRPDTAPAARAGLLQFTEQMAGYASRYLTRQRDAAHGPPGPAAARPHGPGPAVAQPAIPPASPAAGQKPGLTPAFWIELEKFLLQLERGRTVAEVASTAASDGRLLLGVDRVSLARKRGRKTPIEAISGQDKVNPRANLVRKMSALCKTVMAGREPLVYAGKVDGLAPQVEQPLADYVAESNSRFVVIVPLYETGEIVKPEHEDKEKERRVAAKDPKVIGCLVAEQINDSRMPPALREKLDVAADHVAVSLQQAITFERIFLRRTLLAIGRTGEWFHGRKLAKTLAVSAAVAAVALALCLVPFPYRVTSEGRLMPVIQRNVFAPWDGEVTDLRVAGGETVEEGELLAVLRNDELQAEQVRVVKELDEQKTTAGALLGQIDEAYGAGRRDEAIKLEGDFAAARASISGLEKQLEILEDRRRRLKVTAPLAGVVATFQLDQLLRNRPVRRGEVLMEVMDDRGDWHLELDVEDKRMQHILDAIRRKGDVGLSVEFYLATDPERTFDAVLKKVEDRADTDRDLGVVVRVEARPADLEAMPRRRIGAEVRAKINTGNRALGYVLFGDVIEFVRKHLWL